MSWGLAQLWKLNALIDEKKASEEDEDVLMYDPPIEGVGRLGRI